MNTGFRKVPEKGLVAKGTLIVMNSHFYFKFEVSIH